MATSAAVLGLCDDFKIIANGAIKAPPSGGTNSQIIRPFTPNALPQEATPQQEDHTQSWEVAAAKSDAENKLAQFSSDLAKAEIQNYSWAKRKKHDDTVALDWVKTGVALFGIAEAGVGGILRLDKHDQHLGTLFGLSGGYVGGSMNLWAAWWDVRKSKHRDAEYVAIPDDVRS